MWVALFVGLLVVVAIICMANMTAPDDEPEGDGDWVEKVDPTFCPLHRKDRADCEDMHR